LTQLSIILLSLRLPLAYGSGLPVGRLPGISDLSRVAAGGVDSHTCDASLRHAVNVVGGSLAEVEQVGHGPLAEGDVLDEEVIKFVVDTGVPDAATKAEGAEDSEGEAKVTEASVDPPFQLAQQSWREARGIRCGVGGGLAIRGRSSRLGTMDRATLAPEGVNGGIELIC